MNTEDEILSMIKSMSETIDIMLNELEALKARVAALETPENPQWNS